MNILDRMRPTTFADFVGPQAVIEHARCLVTKSAGGVLLLHGPTGLGKTALAKVMARAFLCEQRTAHGDPCGVCASCQGAHSDSIAGEYHFIDAPDDGRVEEISKAVGSANGGRPAALIIDNADNLGRQALQMLNPAIDSGLGTRLIVVTARDPDNLIRRDPSVSWRYPRLAMAPVEEPELVTYLSHVAERLGISIVSDVAQQLVAGAGGSVAIALRRLEGYAATGLPNSIPLSARIVVDGWIASIRQGQRVSFEDDIQATIGAEALHAEMTRRMIACMKALPPFRGLSAPDPSLMSMIVGAGRSLRGGERELAAQLAQVWTAARHKDSASVMIALHKTEAALASGRRSTDHETADPRRVRRLSGAAAGEYLSYDQARKLRNYCEMATAASGATIRITAVLAYDAESGASRAVSEFTHGLNMYLKKRKLGQVGWIYVHRRNDGQPETFLAFVMPLALVEVCHNWICQRVSVLKVCLETSDDRRIAFQEAALCEALRSLDPALYVVSADRTRRFLVDILEIPRERRRPLGERFTERVIGMGGMYRRSAQTADPYVLDVLGGLGGKTLLGLRKRARALPETDMP